MIAAALGMTKVVTRFGSPTVLKEFGDTWTESAWALHQSVSHSCRWDIY
jgi:hypothetical protein